MQILPALSLADRLLRLSPLQPGAPLWVPWCPSRAGKVGWGLARSPCRGKQERWKEGWCGGKVGRYNTYIQVIVVEGKEGVSGGI